MSHFSVMVIGENPEKQLAPFHEYECTGRDDEYVIDVDCTDEINEWLKKELYVGIDRESKKLDYQYNYKNANEKLESFVKMTRKQYLKKQGLNIDDEIKEWFGYEKRENKWFNHTNPNSKWDWYLLGGRWSGMLKQKDLTIGVKGRPGLMTDPAAIGYCDQCIKKNIDIDGMRNEAIDKAAKKYDLAMSIINGEEFESWDSVRNRIESIDEARYFYNNQPVILRWNKTNEFGFFTEPSEFLISKEEYLKIASNNTLVTFAFIKDGKWYERGGMGWWGIVSNEKDRNKWMEQFNKEFDLLPGDTLISIYDCHI